MTKHVILKKQGSVCYYYRTVVPLYGYGLVWSIIRFSRFSECDGVVWR